MFEELYAPLPDAAAYLERINATHSDCSLADLDQLILAHQLSVPFEDLDSNYYKKAVSCSIEDLYQKIVVNRRGGYCFEQNALFVSLLQALGYKAFSGQAKVIRGKDINTPILILHRVNFVEFEDGLYFCDVGYGGPMPSFAIRVEDGSSRTCNGETFHIRKVDGPWWIISRTTSDGTIEDVLMFDTAPTENCDFFVLSHYASTSPLSVFVQLRLVNLRLENGSVSITNDSFTRTENGKTSSCTIESDEQLKALLKEHFNICLD